MVSAKLTVDTVVADTWVKASWAEFMALTDRPATTK